MQRKKPFTFSTDLANTKTTEILTGYQQSFSSNHFDTCTKTKYCAMEEDSTNLTKTWAWVPPRPGNTVEWRGNRVTRKEGIALKHLFDNMQDYFGQPNGEPNVSLSIGRFHPGQEVDGETDSRRKDNSAVASSTMSWKGNLEFMYKVNHRDRDTSLKLQYMAMDICLDLEPKKHLNFGGHDMSEYCRTWMYAYAPRYTVETFLKYFEDGTGFKASGNGLLLDEEQNIVTLDLLIEPQSEPGFWIADEDDNKQLKRVGTVHDAYQHPSNQFLFRCIGIFAVTAEVTRSSSRTHDDDASAINEKEDAQLTFTLMNVRTEGIVNNIAPIVYNPRRCTKFNIDNNYSEWWR